MTERNINKLLNGDREGISPFCIVRDIEHFIIKGFPCVVKWKIIQGLKNCNVTVIDRETALGIIKANGLIPSLSLNGYGTLYDTPDSDFQNEYKQMKVYIDC